MAQVTGQMSFANHRLQYSANGSSWTNISGFSNSVSIDGGDRQASEDYTGEGDVAILTYGKREPFEVTARVVFSHGASDVAEIVRAAYEGNTAFYLQWSPRGGATGDFVYTTSEGRIISHPYPQGEASAADPVMLEITVRCTSITKSVAA